MYIASSVETYLARLTGLAKFGKFGKLINLLVVRNTHINI